MKFKTKIPTILYISYFLIFTLILVFFENISISYCFADTMPIKSKFLQARGRNIYDDYGNGKQVALRGVNVGSWLCQEGWMSSSNIENYRKLRDILTERFGSEKMETLLNVYVESWFNEQDLDTCQDIGINVLRVGFHYLNLQFENGELRPDAFNRIDWLVREAGKRDIYVIIDLHGAPGGQNSYEHSGNYGLPLFFEKPEHLVRATKIWQQVAAHYKDNPVIAGFDILNEPDSASGKKQWNAFDVLYKAIRKVDPDHMIVINGTWNPTALPMPKKYGWKNVMYQYHFYQWGIDNDFPALSKHLDTLKEQNRKSNHNVPVYIGEFNLFGLDKTWEYALNMFNTEGYNWSTWSFKINQGVKSSWGLLNSSAPKADIYKDSYEYIYNNWSQFNSASFFPNEKLQNILFKYFNNSNDFLRLSGASSDDFSQSAFYGNTGITSSTINMLDSDGAMPKDPSKDVSEDFSRDVSKDISGAISGAFTGALAGGFEGSINRTATSALNGAIVGISNAKFSTEYEDSFKSSRSEPNNKNIIRHNQIISGKIYRIIPKAFSSSNQLLAVDFEDNGNNVKILPQDSTNSASKAKFAQWKIIYTNRGFYNFINVGSNNALDAKTTYEIAKTSQGQTFEVQQYPIANFGNDNQQWIIAPIDNKYFKIINKTSAKVLETNLFLPNQIVQLSNFTGKDNQLWMFVEY